jgi:hypothetical protein
LLSAEAFTALAAETGVPEVFDVRAAFALFVALPASGADMAFAPPLLASAN